MLALHSFRRSIGALDALIEMFGLHKSDGPVDFQPALDYLNITVRYFPVPVEGEHGYAFASPGNRMDGLSMVINSLDSPERQRQTKGHELYHLLQHDIGKPHHSYDGATYTPQEQEADLAAAYLAVPLGCLVEGLLQNQTAYEIACELQIPPKLVLTRFNLAIELNELRDLKI